MPYITSTLYIGMAMKYSLSVVQYSTYMYYTYIHCTCTVCVVSLCEWNTVLMHIKYFLNEVEGG